MPLTAAEVAAALRWRRADWLPRFFPAGKVVNGTFYIGSANGDAGRSLPIPLSPDKAEDLIDFGGTFRGDDLDLFAHVRQLELPKAMAEAADFLGLGNPPPQQVNAPVGPRTSGPPTPILPVPPDAPPMRWQHPRHGPPSLTWPYHDAAGRLLGYVARFDFLAEDNTPGKVVLPITFCHLGSGKRGWCPKGLPEPRPLYRLPELLARPNAMVIITEGEKAADAAAALFPDLVATTPMHGAKSPHKADLSVLAGRRVIVWPDHDEPGAFFAEAVARLAKKAGAISVSVVQVPVDWPPAWDLADAPPPGIRVEKLRKMVEDAMHFAVTSSSRLRLVPFDQINVRTTSNAFVKGLLGSNAMSVVYGESGTGKTFWVLDLALHIALGWEWCSRRVRQGGVVYIAAEGAAGISNRVAAFKLHHGINDPAPFAILPTSVNLLDPAADKDELIELIKAAALDLGMPVVLVVVDTLSRALSGGNENAPEDMGALVMNADRIREATGAHVMFVHHSGKDGSKGARGHSLLRAATDTEIEVSRDPASKMSVARITKQKELPTDGEFAFALKVIDLGQDEDGDTVMSCIIAPADREATAMRKRTLPNRARFALETLTDVIVRYGTKAPSALAEHIPHGTTVATVMAWREEFQARSVTDEKPDTLSKAFRRAVEVLQSAGLVAVRKDYVWLVKPLEN